MNLTVPEAVGALSSTFLDELRASPSCFAEWEAAALALSRRCCAEAMSDALERFDREFVLNVGFGIVEGIAVDTHVNRIARRLALSPKTHAAEPLKTEQDLLRVLQLAPVRGDDLLVPEERVLAEALERAVSLVVHVDVDEAVALAHLAGAGRDEVDGSPSGVAHHVNTSFDRQVDLLEVISKILDAIVVMDLAVD